MDAIFELASRAIVCLERKDIVLVDSVGVCRVCENPSKWNVKRLNKVENYFSGQVCR